MNKSRPMFPSHTKEYTRDFVIAAMKSWFSLTINECRKVISLPEKQWVMESSCLDMLSEYGGILDLNLYEKNPAIYDECNEDLRIKSKINNFVNISLSSGMVHHRYVPATFPRFGFSYLKEYLPSLSKVCTPLTCVFAWYDYCGIPSDENINNITVKLPANSVAAVTFSLPWRSRKTQKLGKRSDPKYLEDMILRRFQKKNKYISCIHTLPYRSQKQEMILLIFTNSKAIEKDFKERSKNVRPPKLNIANITRRTLLNRLNKGFSKNYLMQELNLSPYKWNKLMNVAKKKFSPNSHNLTIDQTKQIRNELKAICDEQQRESRAEEIRKKYGLTAHSMAGIKAWIKIESKRSAKV